MVSGLKSYGIFCQQKPKLNLHKVFQSIKNTVRDKLIIINIQNACFYLLGPNEVKASALNEVFMRSKWHCRDIHIRPKQDRFLRNVV